MNPKEKAKQLVNKFEPYVIRYTQDDVIGYLDQETPILEYQKQCALIAVDVFIEYLRWTQDYHLANYWREVKQEIEKL